VHDPTAPYPLVDLILKASTRSYCSMDNDEWLDEERNLEEIRVEKIGR
jgi:hypothetical protein